MKDIIAIQPDIAKGYDTIDEAIQRNIGTLETYIDTLRTQTETQLMQAELEFLSRKNKLEQERNILIEKRADLESRIGPEQREAMEFARQVAELENLFSAGARRFPKALTIYPGLWKIRCGRSYRA